MLPESAPFVGGKLVQLIVFQLGAEDFAIPIGSVREIIRNAPITPVPGVDESFKGIINVRGEIAAAVDLRVRFGLPPRKDLEPKRIVITAQGKNLFGLVVDEVAEVLRVSTDEIKPPPEIARTVERSCVTGVIVKEGRLIILLDLAKLLENEPPAAERGGRP